MVSQRIYFQMVVIKDSLYAIGGLPTSNTMEVINIKNGREWVQEELPFSVFSHCAVVINNNIIVTGGYSHGTVSEKLYTSKNKFQT